MTNFTVVIRLAPERFYVRGRVQWKGMTGQSSPQKAGKPVESRLPVCVRGREFSAGLWTELHACGFSQGVTVG
jgi:hypothetical protein